MERKPLARLRPKIKLPQWAITLYTSMTSIERAALGILLLLLIASGTASVLRFIQTRTQLIPQDGGIYREAAVGQPRYLNPILASANDLDIDITRLVYSGLFRYNSDFELVGDLATDVEISDNQKEYTIHLKPDVSWHDGQPLTVDDVVFTIRSIQTPDYGSPLSPMFQGVTIEKVDDTTVRFILTQPYTPFLSSLTVGIVPEHVWSQIEPQNAPLAEQMLKPIGSGPFKFAEIITRRKTGDITTLRLARNETYYGTKPHLDEITFTFFTSHEEATDALLSDQADGVGFLPLQLLDRAQSGTRIIHRLLLPQYFGLFFNQQKNEVLRDASVRSAFALATNRQRIVTEALNSQGEVLHLPIPANATPYQGDFAIPVEDTEAAKQNLTDNGWEDRDGDGIREKDGQKLKVTITTTDWPEYIKTAQIIQQQWQAIGAKVELEHLSAGTIQQTIIQPRDYEILLFGQILPAEPDPYPFWHSTQTRSPGLNLALFKNEEVDKLLEEARKQPDVDQRQEKLQEFQNKILELNPAIILYQPYYLFATSRNVRGVNANYAALPAGRFNNIEQWHVKVERVWKKN